MNTQKVKVVATAPYKNHTIKRLENGDIIIGAERKNEIDELDNSIHPMDNLDPYWETILEPAIRDMAAKYAYEDILTEEIDEPIVEDGFFIEWVELMLNDKYDDYYDFIYECLAILTLSDRSRLRQKRKMECIAQNEIDD